MARESLIRRHRRMKAMTESESGDYAALQQAVEEGLKKHLADPDPPHVCVECSDPVWRSRAEEMVSWPCWPALALQGAEALLEAARPEHTTNCIIRYSNRSHMHRGVDCDDEHECDCDLEGRQGRRSVTLDAMQAQLWSPAMSGMSAEGQDADAS